MVAACGVFYDAVLDDAIRIRPHPMLELSLKSARKKMIASGWLWSRTTEEADLTPLFAATLAYHHATNRQAPETKRSAIF
jgi:hypothetical protein